MEALGWRQVELAAALATVVVLGTFAATCCAKWLKKEHADIHAAQAEARVGAAVLKRRALVRLRMAKIEHAVAQALAELEAGDAGGGAGSGAARRGAARSSSLSAEAEAAKEAASLARATGPSTKKTWSNEEERVAAMQAAMQKSLTGPKKMTLKGAAKKVQLVRRLTDSTPFEKMNSKKKKNGARRTRTEPRGNPVQ